MCRHLDSLVRGGEGWSGRARSAVVPCCVLWGVVGIMRWAVVVQTCWIRHTLTLRHDTHLTATPPHPNPPHLQEMGVLEEAEGLLKKLGMKGSLFTSPSSSSATGAAAAAAAGGEAAPAADAEQQQQQQGATTQQ